MGPRWWAPGRAPPRGTAFAQRSTRRSRSALRMTETELNVMATLAIIGLSRMPKNG